MNKIIIVIAAVVIAGLVASGCSEKRVNEFEAAQAQLAENPNALDGVFSGEIVLCRNVARSSGHRMGVTDAFRAGEGKRVYGFVDFSDAELGQLYTLHLVWIKPDDHELYRKYAEVRVEAADEGYRSIIHWKKADDLHYLKEEVQESDKPGFTLDSAFSTYYRHEPRDLGEYKLRVYLFRDLMLEKSFTLSA